jgi:hypothetical protein
MEETTSRYGAVAANILNKQSPTSGGSQVWGLGQGANNSSPKTACYETLYGASELEGGEFLE